MRTSFSVGRVHKVHDAVAVDLQDTFYLLEVSDGIVDVGAVGNAYSYSVERLVVVDDFRLIVLDCFQQLFLVAFLRVVIPDDEC